MIVRKLTATTQFLVWGALLLVSACTRSPRPAAPASLAAQSHPTHVDSLVSREVALQRFRQGTNPVTALAGGANSRDALVGSFLHALARRDTSELKGLLLSRDEFAWLYYPTSAQGLPPYSLNPDLMWFMLVEQGNRGLRRAVNQLGGKQLAYAGTRCEGTSTKEEENVLWGPCLVRWRESSGKMAEARLFGPILEREGRFKFLSYGNKL